MYKLEAISSPVNACTCWNNAQAELRPEHELAGASSSAYTDHAPSLMLLL